MRPRNVRKESNAFVPAMTGRHGHCLKLALLLAPEHRLPSRMILEHVRLWWVSYEIE
jgi:hypothetical protein